MPSKKPNRRGFLKNSAKLAGLAAGGIGVSKAADEFTNTSKPKGYMSDDEIAYGQRSHYVTSKRVSVMGRHSPDEYGLMFHVNSPLQDQIGFLTPTPLFYLATHRGSYIPDIDPKEHRLMIHGMVDRPLIFTVDDIKRLPSVTRIHMIECLGNRANATHTTVQETHGLTSSAEWTGVELSLLLREAGVQPGASWVVAEGVEEVKGSSCFELAKAMEDSMVVYAMNGEPLRIAKWRSWAPSRTYENAILGGFSTGTRLKN